MTNRKIKWSRSEEGFVKSADGDYEIWPLFVGRTTPVAYKVSYRGVSIHKWCETQKEAKAEAERHASR